MISTKFQMLQKAHSFILVVTLNKNQVKCVDVIFLTKKFENAFWVNFKHKLN